MKNTSFFTKLILGLLFSAVFVYFGIEGYRYLVNPISTTLVYAYSAEEAVGLRGYVVRDETVIECSEPLLELTHAEGERVAAGKSLATVYRSEDALNEARELETLRAQLEQLTYAESAKSDTEASLLLDKSIRDDIIALRTALESDDYSALYGLSNTLKTTVLRRELAYGTDTDLEALIAQLETRIETLSASVQGAASTVCAPFAGTYSAVIDGYESVLTPEALEDLSPSALRSLRPTELVPAIGKLIRGTTWYYVSAASADDIGGLSVGETYSLRMASGVDFDLEATVLKIGRAEDGECLLVLCSDRSLSDVTLLRSQSAELVVRSYEGLRIPKNALRVGENGQSGVYCLVGLTACFKPVRVLYQGGDYCLVEPGEINASTEGQLSLYTLRAGDEVIISSVALYDGKVVE